MACKRANECFDSWIFLDNSVVVYDSVSKTLQKETFLFFYNVLGQLKVAVGLITLKYTMGYVTTKQKLTIIETQDDHDLNISFLSFWYASL